MTIQERKEGRKEGRQEGRKEGRQEGRKEGRTPSPVHPPTRFYFFNRLPSVPTILLLFHKHHPFLGLISTLLISIETCAYVLLSWYALRGEALRPPPAPPTRFFLLAFPFWTTTTTATTTTTISITITIAITITIPITITINYYYYCYYFYYYYYYY